MTPAPVLAGLVYVYSVNSFYDVIQCCGVRQLFEQSYFALLPDGVLVDVHIISGLKPFANCVKLCVYGPALKSADVDILINNRRRFVKGVLAMWKSQKSRQSVQVLSGFINGDLPPFEALVPIDDALASESVQIFITKQYPKENGQ